MIACEEVTTGMDVLMMAVVFLGLTLFFGFLGYVITHWD